MTIVAGYASPRGSWPDRQLEQRLDAFSVDVNGERLPTERREMKRWHYGHVVAIRGEDGPCQPGFTADPEGNFLIASGYILSQSSEGFQDQLAAAVRTEARSFESDCEGEFIVLCYIKEKRRLHIVNDRFAARALYLHRSGETIVFSSSLPLLRMLLDRPLEACPLGWAQILCHTHTISPTTTFQDTERLSPATHLTLGPAQSRSSYWRLRHRPQQLRPEEHADEVFHAFENSVRQRARLCSRAYVPLSGGLDSRLIAACVPEGLNVPCFTFNPSVSDEDTAELSAAREVASLLGHEHHVAKCGLPTQIGERCDGVVWGTGGQKGIHHVAGGAWPPDELVKGRLRLGGGPGDVLAGSYPKSIDYIDEARTDQCIEHFVRLYLQGSALGALAEMMPVDRANDLAEEVLQRMLDTTRGMSGPTAAHKVTAWSMVYRQTAFTLLSGMHQKLDRADCCPHLDYTYSSLMLELPADWLYRRNFYQYLIYRCIPKLRCVVYANTGRRLPAEMTDYRKRSRPPVHMAVLRRALSKPLAVLRGGMRRASAGSARPKPFLFEALQRDESLQERVRAWSRRSAAALSLLDPDRVCAFVDDFAEDRVKPAGYGAAQERFGALATLCVADEILGSRSGTTGTSV